MKFNSIKFFSFLIYILPAALISGPLFPELIVLSCNIFFLIKVIQEKKFYYFDNIFFKFFLVFWIILNFSALFSDNILYSLKYSISYIRYGIFILSVSYFISKNEKLINSFYKYLIFTFIIILIDSYFQFFFNFNLLGLEKPNSYIISGLFNDEWILGTYLMRLSPLLVGLYLYFNKANQEKFNSYLFYLALIFPMIFLSGQRTPFYLSIIFLLASLIILKLDKKKFLCLLFSLSIIVSNILIDNKKYDGIGSGYKNRMFSDIIFNYKNIPQHQENQIDKNKYLKLIFISPGHNTLWFTAIELFKQKKILGHGPNSFRIKCENIKNNKEYVCSTHPHNYFFQLLAETGLISALIYISIYILVLKYLFNYYLKLNHSKNRYLLEAKLFLLLSIIINFAPLVPSGNFFNNHQNILIYLPIAFLLNFMNSRGK